MFVIAPESMNSLPGPCEQSPGCPAVPRSSAAGFTNVLFSNLVLHAAAMTSAASNTLRISPPSAEVDFHQPRRRGAGDARASLSLNAQGVSSRPLTFVAGTRRVPLRTTACRLPGRALVPSATRSSQSADPLQHWGIPRIRYLPRASAPPRPTPSRPEDRSASGRALPPQDHCLYEAP